jgi:hypothetical protein
VRFGSHGGPLLPPICTIRATVCRYYSVPLRISCSVASSEDGILSESQRGRRLRQLDRSARASSVWCNIGRQGRQSDRNGGRHIPILKARAAMGRSKDQQTVSTWLRGLTSTPVWPAHRRPPSRRGPLEIFGDSRDHDGQDHSATIAHCSGQARELRAHWDSPESTRGW